MMIIDQINTPSLYPLGRETLVPVFT